MYSLTHFDVVVSLKHTASFKMIKGSVKGNMWISLAPNWTSSLRRRKIYSILQ
jgi:hypothetical protein